MITSVPSELYYINTKGSTGVIKVFKVNHKVNRRKLCLYVCVHVILKHCPAGHLTDSLYQLEMLLKLGKYFNRALSEKLICYVSIILFLTLFLLFTVLQVSPFLPLLPTSPWRVSIILILMFYKIAA